MRPPAHPLHLATQLIRRRSLLWQLSRRDVLSRYRGSALGLLWSFVTPLLMLAVYTFVYSYIFKARGTPGADAAHPQAAGLGAYAIYLFAGLSIHACLAENLSRSSGLIVGQANLVKKVVFPLELLPATLLLSTLFHFAISLLVLILAKLALTQALPWTVVYLPLILAPFALVCLAADYVFAALGVFLRDIGQLITLSITVLMFLSPVFYPIGALPEALRPIVMLNPLSLPIEEVRAVLIDGRQPDFGWLGIYTVCAIGLLGLGFAFFQRTRKAFADIL